MSFPTSFFFLSGSFFLLKDAFAPLLQEPRDTNTRSSGSPTIQSTATEEKASNGKRDREEDGGAGEPAAKKVDTKEQATTEA